MATLRPFRALRPARERAADVAAVPYDVVDRSEATALAQGNPWSFLRVSRAEIDLPIETEVYSDAVYSRAAENFERLRREAPLEQDVSPCLYIWRLRMGDHEQTGVAGAFSLDEYDWDLIRKHERTRKEKEDDRTRHMIALGVQTGPVFLAYRGRSEIDAAVEAAKRREPLYDFTASDGVTHALWRLEGGEAGGLAEQFRPLPWLYIADGHHRAASASRARAELTQRARKATGEEPHDFFLAVAFPSSQLRILPYNRVVKDLNGRKPEEFLAELGRQFPVSDKARPEPSRKGEVSVYVAGRWHGLSLPDAASAARGAASRLDVAVLQERVIEPLLSIRDVRTDKRIDFVGGIRGPAELMRLVDSGRAAVAFSMYPVSLDELMAIADAGEILPPKSTWFEPKLRDGLLIHRIGAGAAPAGGSP